MRTCRQVTNLHTELRVPLNKLLKSPSIPAALYKRARAISLLMDGVGPIEAAKIAGMDRVNVFRWARRFQCQGICGLYNLPRPRKPLIPVERVESGPAESILAKSLQRIREKQHVYGDE